MYSACDLRLLEIIVCSACDLRLLSVVLKKKMSDVTMQRERIELLVSKVSLPLNMHLLLYVLRKSSNTFIMGTAIYIQTQTFHVRATLVLMQLTFFDN